MERLARVGLKETVDIEKLQFIIDNWHYFDGESNNIGAKSSEVLKNQCEKYLENAKKNKQVKYFQVNGVGRYFAKGGLSLQNIPRKIRGSISEEFYYDLDMQNCHPVILLNLFKKHQINHSSLEKYVNSRDSVIAALCKKNPDVSKSEAKTLILKIINNGEYFYKKVKNKTTWLKEYFIEIKAGLGELSRVKLAEYNEAVAYCKDSDKNNVLGRFISCVLCAKENELLKLAVGYLIEKNVIQGNAVFCFDGIMLKKELVRDDIKEHIEAIEKIFKENGECLKLVVKPMESYNMSDRDAIVEYCKNKMEEQIEIDILENNNNEDVLIDNKVEYRKLFKESEYYWYDFVQDVCRRGDLLKAQVENKFKCNINKVMFRCFDGSRYIIKISKDKLFYINSKLPEETVHWYEIDESGKVTQKSQTLGKVITGHGWMEHIHFYNSITFDPSNKDSDYIFNTWTGFKADLLDEKEVELNKHKLEPIFDLLKNVWCGGNNGNLFKYVISWFHHAFRYPYRKNKVALILYSALQQVGKGIFINEFLIPHIYGKSLSMSMAGLEGIVTHFNSHLMNKLFVNCDELQSISGDFHGTFDALKKIVTDPTITINIKYCEPITNYPNYMDIICSTNNVDSFKMECGDSRYCVLECSPMYRGNQKYFKDLVDSSFNKEMGSLFFSYCYHMEDPLCLKNIPVTPLRKQMIFNSLSSPKKFVYTLADAIETHGFTEEKKEETKTEEEEETEEEETETEEEETETNWFDGLLSSTKVTRLRFYQYYKTYCAFENEKPKSNTKFGRDISDLLPKIKNNGVYYYKLDKIKKL